MDYIQDLRNADTIERLRPYFDMIAKGHEGMHDGINIAFKDPTGTAVTYATDIDLLRSAFERVLRRQNEVAELLVLAESDAEVECDKLIGQALGLPSERRLDRKPFDDDMN